MDSASTPALKDNGSLTTLDRFQFGNFTIDEVCHLRCCSRSVFYEDLKAGLVSIRKAGRKSLVPGPIAKRYIAGEPLAETAEAA